MLAEDALWFDVEKRYKTIIRAVHRSAPMLWFDVEKRYKTIQWGTFWEELWFDVEKDIRQLASSEI